MTKRAQLADGTALEFPDDTPDDVIDRAVHAHVNNPVNDSKLTGLVSGALKPLDNMVNWASALPGFDAVDRFGQYIGLPSAKDAIAGNNEIRANNTRTGWQAIGNMLGTAPTLAIPGGLAAQGAASGALLSNGTTASEVASDAAKSALTSKIGGSIFNGIGAIAAPKLSDGVRKLVEAGVRDFTPGQLASGLTGFIPRMVNKTEEALTSAYGLGDLISNARNATQSSYEQALGNRVLSNIGQTLPKAIKGASDIVGYATGQVNKAYENLVPHLKLSFDDQFANDMMNAAQTVKTLPDTIQKQFENIVRGALVNRSYGTGMAGQPLKEAEAFLTKQIRTYAPKGGDHAILADAIAGVRQALRDGISRANPRFAQQLQALNQAWAQLRPMRKVLGDQADDALSPARMFQATKPYKDDLVRAGKQVLTNATPDSGTARRVAATVVAGGLGSGIPMLVGAPASALAAPAVAAAMYTKPAIQALNKLVLAERGKAANAIADASRWIGSHAGGLLPGLLGNIGWK